MIVKLLFFSFFLTFSDASVQVRCFSYPKPSFNNRCPDGYTMITDGTCCSNGDVYVVGDTTTAPLIPCQDKLNPKTGYSDCPRMKSYCQDPKYKSLMKEQCPKTCGYCTSSATSNTTKPPTASKDSCQDLIPMSGISNEWNCPGIKSHCLKRLVQLICPKTCGLCTSLSTSAATTNTTAPSDSCQECPKTCGYCTSSPTTTASPDSCQDYEDPKTGVSNCSKLRSYCYSPSIQDHCPKTCGLCTSSPTSSSPSSTTTPTTTTSAPSTTTTAPSDSCQGKIINSMNELCDCPEVKSSCHLHSWQLMCPKTCGSYTSPTSSPTSTACQDKLSPSTGKDDCPEMASLCKNPIYYDMMKDECPKTCGYCS